MQPWQAVRSLFKVIYTNSTLAASQVPVCRVPAVACGDDLSVYTDLSTKVSCIPARLQIREVSHYTLDNLIRHLSNST